MDILSISCPACGHQLKMRDRSLLGRAARCPECRHKFVLEESATEHPSEETLAVRDTVAPGRLSVSLDDDTGDNPPVLKKFGRYELLEELGHGTMGAVYLARDAQLNRQVALKVPHVGEFDDEESIHRFYREARSAATLRHPNICPVFDVGEVEGAHYLTMAYIEGRTLSHCINRDRLQSERQIVGIIRKLASALQHAHNKGIVHRDLKPANIMIDVRNDPIVMDFGLAVQVDQQVGRFTQRGVILGTPAYMPPEQVRGDTDQVGPQSDIYSLGVILYELLTAEIPFDGPITVVMERVVSEEPRPPSAFRADVSPQLESICLKMMAKEIDDRYQTMKEVDAALVEFLKQSKKRVDRPGKAKRKSTELANGDSGVAAIGENEPSDQSRPVVVGAIVLLAVIGLIFCLIAYFLNSGEEPQSDNRSNGGVFPTGQRLPSDRGKTVFALRSIGREAVPEEEQPHASFFSHFA